jgi:hypothetical protein
MGASLFDDYAAPFGLRKYGEDFRVQRDDSEVFHGIDSPVLQAAVRGRILFLDTMLDYARIQKAFESSEWIEFFAKLRLLIRVHGCIAIVMLVHPTKTGAKSNTIEPSEYLKDSVTFGGKIDVGFAFSKIPNTSQIFVQRIKGRGFKERNFAFTIKTHGEDGENFLDQGRFPIHLKPGEAGKREDHTPEKRGRKADHRRDDKINFLMALEGEKLGAPEKTKRLNEHFGTHHPESTIKTWLTQGRREKKDAEDRAALAASTVIGKAQQDSEPLLDHVEEMEP